MSGPYPAETLADLTGWKDVAAYLGRSVRTVQRWERELGLPVHRIRTQAGEVIYARRGELDGWLESRQGDRATGPDFNGDSGGSDSGIETSEDRTLPARPPDTGGRRGLRRARWFWASVLGLALTAVVAVIAGRGWPVGGSQAQPSSWSVENGALAIHDGAGRLLWTHGFDFPLDAERMKSSGHRYADAAAEWVVLADLEGDGQTEVLVVPFGQQRRGGLYCFESNGRLRFTHEVRRTVRFGGETFGPPFVSMPPYVVARGRHTSIWVPSLHSPFFPAVVHKLTAEGEVAGQYWQAGHPVTLREIERDGRPLLVVGGTRNEDFTAALSVLEVDNPAGSAPADVAKYRCFDCPAFSPAVFVSFPRIEIGRIAGQRSVVRDIREVPGGLLVGVHYVPSQGLGDGPCLGAEAYYRLDDDFRIVSADFGDSYVICHARLRLDGRLDHDFGPRDVAELFPVRAWYNGVLEAIARPASLQPAGPAPR